MEHFELLPRAERYWRRVCRLLIDLELTQKILQVRQLQSESRLGTWPREIPGIESSICSGAQWVYQVTPEGTMSLAFSRKLEWPGSAADFSLPLTYTEQAQQGRARSRL